MKCCSIAIGLGLCVLLLGGCERGGVKEAPAEAAEETIGDEDSTTRGIGGPDSVEGTQYGDQPGYPGGPQDDPQSLLSQRVIYFDFDSSEVPAESLEIISAHGLYLGDHPEVRATLEGHGDERGSREYNIGLGERRAQAVSRLLLLQGVAEEQLQSVSFGEEQPAAFGHDEESWRLNRRVEIKY